jgi:branched-chain amino acid aminotransferase
MHRFLLHNGRVLDTTQATVSPGQVGVLNGWGVFSTLRVQDGVLFAWERHWARMKKDAERMRVPIPLDPDQLHQDLLHLVAANQTPNATLRVAIIRNRGGLFETPNVSSDYDIVAFTKDLTEWPDHVRLMVKHNARHSNSEFAGAKILSWSMNLTWLEEAHAAGYNEMLLLDERGYVSECTGANIFAVQGNSVWTPPLSSGCLPGVTRAILLEDIRLPGITINEREMDLEELAQADEVFITSSTRDLLRVAEVEEVPMGAQDSIRRQLADAFVTYRQSYVSQATLRYFPAAS